MAYNRLNNPIYWERGPVVLARLRGELKAYEAMGNVAAANLIRAEIKARERYVAASDELHEKEQRLIGFDRQPRAPRSSDKMDTQGR